ncbi:mediator of RNA polymerase II transcription subunit 10 [Plasmodium brasilianum]|uniref:Uncharacterized protein n=2 Tax=Plasmodium (Plasmodium) TaxID=418103 RepID=A0A1A8WZ17_PLAMA|nr:conserved Plasmodium protein, unknown function [Plasmodium malariae]KAI4841214.1 mediator of RNA polymerase II transcription subunit 10 [Plasmodium brasilianum]SBS96654.1 conserved Plasmodium protein, unknown function [Plasmodium malariae]SBT86898.1 conserved Plasmodium protein, unknown function [Plasmodium malariae]
MSESKGRIKLKINLGNDEDSINNYTSSDPILKKKKKSSTLLSDSDKSKENLKDEDNNSCGSDKRLKDNNLEKKIISIISKLTKIACICENKKNNLNSNNINNSNNNSINNSNTNSNNNSNNYSNNYSNNNNNNNNNSNSNSNKNNNSNSNTNSESGKICKKLIKQMYKYEKCLNNLNNFINDNNNCLDDITFPNGLIKAVDNYMSADAWAYEYLLVECKKQNDKYRNIIQNISTFDSTLRYKIINEGVGNKLTMPIYAPVAGDKLNFLSEGYKNYYKNVHIPKELAEPFFEDVKRRKTGAGLDTAQEEEIKTYTTLTTGR